MSSTIRIIKRSERDARGKSAQQKKKSRVPETASTRHATRDITGHVATWIKDLQQRHTPDPRRAFANLFVDPATSAVD